MLKIDAIIPTYNQHQYLIDAIDSLLVQSITINSIIIVDNASTDNTTKIIQKQYEHNQKIKIITLSKNTGVVGGRNEGLKHIKDFDYVLFFDHDMVAEPKMLEQLLITAQKKDSIGIVTPKIYYWENKKIIWSAGTDINLTNGQNIFRGGEDKGQYQKEQQVGVAPAVLLTKKQVIQAIGNFDPIYYHSYEDTDFCFRAKNVGYQTYYTPQAIAYHKIPYDLDQSNIRLLKLTYYIARNRIIFMRKYSQKFIIFLAFIPIFFIYYASLAIKYHKYKSIIEYLRGTASGLTTKY